MVITKATNSGKTKARAQWQALSSRQDLAVATFAGGCFWCMEGPFEQLDGVEEVMAGYVLGSQSGLVEDEQNAEDGSNRVEVEDNPNQENTNPDPTYEQVSSGQTQYREGIQIFYDPSRVTYQQLLELYWFQIDPTDDAGQFADRGFQYSPAVYFHSAEEEAEVQRQITQLNQSGQYDAPIAVAVEAFGSYSPAEDYHQDYYKHAATRYKLYEQGSGRKSFKEQQKDKLRELFGGQQ